VTAGDDGMSEHAPRIKIREATPDDAAGVARVHVISSRATYLGLLPEVTLSEMTYRKRTVNWSKTLEDRSGGEFVFVAERGGEVVGFASGGPERGGDADFDGELYAVYLLPEHQRRGAGRRLVLAVAERLARLGFRSLMLWVLADNPACRFYEALGGARIRATEIEGDGRALTKVAYGWADIEALIERLRASR
jgi:ribosomal protein S18 acetylase RimI-like enzyme